MTTRCSSCEFCLSGPARKHHGEAGESRSALNADGATVSLDNRLHGLMKRAHIALREQRYL